MRELKEETGYVGVVSQSSPIMFNGKTKLSFLVFGDDADNLAPRPRILQYKPQNGACHSRYV